MVHLGWQGGGVGVRIGGSVVRRHEVGHDVDGHREDHLDHDVFGLKNNNQEDRQNCLDDGDIGDYGEESRPW